MIEVEVKAHANKDFSKLEEDLLNLGAVRVGDEFQEDTYFNAPHRDFSLTDEALRIRKIHYNDSEDIYITYKGAKMDKVSKTRKEVEVKVEDSLKVADILQSLSFQRVATVRKNRIIYNLGDLIITLDEVHGVGNFVEIEKEVEEGEDTQEALSQIFSTYSEIGIKDGFERRSYLELMGIQ
ncbi:MAG: class IV adenylate cyclase [Methanobacteriaceae archaeon]|nr:class IV adenylate cyclase [Methanobacteriaceae archaeon]